MAERQTHYPATKDNAILLLAAAEELGVEHWRVTTSREGFTAPQEVLDKAFPPKRSTRNTKSEE